MISALFVLLLVALVLLEVVSIKGALVIAAVVLVCRWIFGQR